MKRLIPAVLIATTLLVTGCYHYNSSLPGTIRDIPARDYTVVGTFEVELERRWWLWGLGKLRQDAIDQKVRAAVHSMGGDGAANVEITTESDGGDIVFSLLNVILPCGWYARHMVITGQAVKFK